jgi:hypothetical protein
MDAVGDVAVLDGRIVAIGTELGTAERTIDATGLVVAPGFIDLHAHGQSIPADRMQAFDGVTTTLDLEAGVLPVASWYRRQAAQGRVLNYGASTNWAFARMGGIYALERISQESPRDYWTVMENLTAFVRERTQRTEAERLAERLTKPRDQRIAEHAYELWEIAGRLQEMYGKPPATDIEAVLTVVHRRSEAHRALEARDGKRLSAYSGMDERNK